MLAESSGSSATRRPCSPPALVRRSLLEVLPDGRFDMLTPIRSTAPSSPPRPTTRRGRAGLLRWADRVAPEDLNSGAADAPWLADLTVMRRAITRRVRASRTRATLGYGLANRVFSSLYTAMRAREAVEILEAVLVSGDGPATIGAQVARRAGIAASEVRGTYEGMWLLERSDAARRALRPTRDLELATQRLRSARRCTSTPGSLEQAETEARRAIELDRRSGRDRAPGRCAP